MSDGRETSCWWKTNATVLKLAQLTLEMFDYRNLPDSTPTGAMRLAEIKAEVIRLLVTNVQLAGNERLGPCEETARSLPHAQGPGSFPVTPTMFSSNLTLIRQKKGLLPTETLLVSGSGYHHTRSAGRQVRGYG